MVRGWAFARNLSNFLVSRNNDLLPEPVAIFAETDAGLKLNCPDFLGMTILVNETFKNSRLSLRTMFCSSWTGMLLAL